MNQESEVNLNSCRHVLTRENAIEIYTHKLLMLQASNDKNEYARDSAPLRGRSGSLSEEFHISAKTVRDIWNHRTWKRATCHLWGAVNTNGIHQVLQLAQLDLSIVVQSIIN